MKQQETYNFYHWLADYRVPPFAYKKADLAQLYRNNSTASMSRKQLLSLFKTSKLPKSGKTLMKALKEKGYTVKRMFFTIQEVRLIFEYLGEPALTEQNQDFSIKNGYISERDLELADILRSGK